jgi:RNA polymerase sigma-70 factor (ECF subfamily)
LPADPLSLRTWVRRVAHNIATHVIRQQRTYAGLVSLEEVEGVAVRQENESGLDRRMIREHLLSLIPRLKPTDRQVILLYLEGVDAASIREITGQIPEPALADVRFSVFGDRHLCIPGGSAAIR